MKSGIRSLVKRSLSQLSLSRLVRYSGTRPLSVFYHTAFDNAPAYFAGMYQAKTPKEFEADIDALLAELTPVGLHELLSAKSDSELPDASFFLSFDDGYREVADIVAPILQRKGVPATFFICSTLIDNQAWFFEDQLGLILTKLRQLNSEATRTAIADKLQVHGHTLESLKLARVPQLLLVDELAEILEIDWDQELKDHRPYVTSAHVEKLKADGFGIGAHGTNHTLFETMTPDCQLQQIEESCEAIANRFDLNYKVFAFPYGEFGVSPDVLEQVRSRQLADHLFGTRGLIEDEYQPFLRQRLWCENHPDSFQRYLKSNLADKLMRRWRGNDRVSRSR